MQRIELLRSSLEDLENSRVTLLNGELCLLFSNDTGYDSLVVGDGFTEARHLPRISLNRSGGSTFLGIANPTTDPGSPLSDIFYLAKESGEYKLFGDITLEEGEIALLLWKYGGWTKITVLEQVSSIIEVTNRLKELSEKVVLGISLGGNILERNEDGTVTIPVDSELSNTSPNPIQNKVVSNVLDWYEGD